MFKAKARSSHVVIVTNGMRGVRNLARGDQWRVDGCELDGHATVMVVKEGLSTT